MNYREFVQVSVDAQLGAFRALQAGHDVATALRTCAPDHAGRLSGHAADDLRRLSVL